MMGERVWIFCFGNIVYLNVHANKAKRNEMSNDTSHTPENCNTKKELLPKSSVTIY